MTRGRSFLVLMVLALGLGAYIYFVEAGRDPLAGETKEKVFAIEPGAVEEVEVRADSGAVTRLQKTGDEWRIVEPAALAPDVAQISGLVSTLEALEAQHVVDENPASVAQYGLEPARITVAFRTAGDTVMRRLDVGDKTPTGGDLYARVEGQPRLILIAGYLEASLNKTTFDLRDKTVLAIDRDVDRVRLSPAGKPAIALSRDENDWRMTEPVAARADFGAVDGLVSKVLQAEMKSIAAESADDLSTYGLDRPQATVVLGKASAGATLEIGAKADESTVYARDPSQPLIFTLDATLVDELTSDPANFRMKDLFLFRSFNAAALELTLDGRPIAFAKRAPAAAEGADATTSAAPVWTQVAPEEKDVDQTQVTQLLTSVSNLRAESFVERPVASGQELIVVARFGDATTPSEERVTFRKSGDVVHAIVPGEPGAAVVATSSFDAVLAAIKELAGIQ
jgi:hypothetical protein